MENQPTQSPQAPTPTTPETPPQQQTTSPVSSAKKAQPTLGFVGLGLAVVGTILACIPAILIVGLFVLLAAFVVSVIAITKKNTTKWPSIVGLVLSVIAGIIGSIIFIIALTVNLVDRANQLNQTGNPSSTQQSSDAKNEASKDRPSPEEIGESVKIINQSNGLTTYDDMPDFYPCVGDFVYKSDLSDETVRLMTDGYDPLPEERAHAVEVIQNSVFTCDPQPGMNSR